MNKIIPFKRDISFENPIAEIRSISLEHSYKVENNIITGNFIISGNYKLTDATINLDNFEFDVPFDISIDKKYDIKNVTSDINDFFYELVNNQVLSVNIELLIDGLIEKEVREVEEIKDIESLEDEEEIKETEAGIMKDESEITKSLEIFNETKEKPKEFEVVKENLETEEIAPVSNNINVKSIFDNMDESEGYVIYKVHVITENDSVQTIEEKYNISKEKLEIYNNLEDLKIGAKLIIPNE